MAGLFPRSIIVLLIALSNGWGLAGWAAAGDPSIALAAAQNIAQSNSEPEPDREAAIKRAKEIRAQFVDEFGTEDDKYGFSHPGSRWGSTQVRRSSVDVWVDVFARHLGQMSGYEASGKGNNTLGKKLGGMAKAAFWSELSRLIGQIPHAQEALAAAANRAQDAGDISQRDKTARTLLTLADGLTRQLLDPDDQSKYSQALAAGDYSIQTAYLFKAVSKAFQAQEFPSPYVLWLSDIEHGEIIRKELLKMFPGNPHLQPDDYYFNGGEYHRRQVITDTFQTFFSEGFVDLMNPESAANFAKRLQQGRGDDDWILDAYGKDGLRKAKNDANTYTQMKNSAAARLTAEFYFASSLTGMPQDGSSPGR